MNIQINKVSSSKELDQFINFPKYLYASDKNFIFEPFSMQKEFLSDKNYFFEHSGAEYFLAVSDNKIVGRIASIRNNVHNRIYKERTGFFGLFESVDNYEVAELLFDKVKEIHKLSGFDKISGPTNLTTNDSCGMLVSGFDSPPVIMMPYNKEYYNDFLVRYGFTKETDLYSYYIGDEILTSPSFEKLANRISKNLTACGITFRKINYRMLDHDIIQMRQVYNESNKSNWGFIPLTENEFSKTAHQFRQFVPDNLILLVEKDEHQIGFAVALPDLNQVFSHIRSGRMFPFGFVKYLYYKRKISNSRILILGILDEYRNRGIDIVLYKKIQENLAVNNIYHGEASYVMENNLKMNSIMEKIGGIKIKSYRIYKLEI